MKNSANLGHINLTGHFSRRLGHYSKFSSKLWPQDVLADCSFPYAQRTQGATQRTLSYVYIRFWDNITSLNKTFLVCNPVSQLIFLYTTYCQSTILHRCTKKYTPSPACTFSVHSNISLLCTLIKRGAKEIFAILKIKTIHFHSWFIFFSLKGKSKFYSLY